MSLDYGDYTVGWISTLAVELSSAQALLDEEHDDLPALPGDENAYSLGRIGNHNVVIACLPQGIIGTTPAATVATNLLRSFPNIRFGLMVGIGGGVPDAVRLGDIVVSKPEGQTGGVIQYDLGKSTANTFLRQGILPPPPTAVSTAVAKLSATAMRKGYKFHKLYEKMLGANPLMTQFRRPSEDVLFEKDYTHVGGHADCSRCDHDRIVIRVVHTEPNVHYGLIGSGNSFIRDTVQRDNLYEQEGIICFEMEAAGLMKDFPCLVIRGISNYCDSHENKQWQPYASGVAAAYAKELLLTLAQRSVEIMPKSKILEVVKDDLDEIKVHHVRTITAQQSSALREALDWVAASDPEENFQRARQLKEPYTGTWVINSGEYVGWKTGQTRHIWVHGKPGCGKSVLTSTAILDIEQHCQAANADLAMFYFTFTDVRKQSWLDCIKSLVTQVANRDPATSMLVAAHQQVRRPSSPSEKFLREVFLATTASYESFFILLDGLDESPKDLDGNNQTRYILFQNLIALSEEATNLKFFLTSRDLVDIRGYMEQLAIRRLLMASNLVDNDIKTYLVSQMKKDPNLSGWSTEVKGRVELTLTEKANGMFRWVYCQLHQLKKLQLAQRGDIFRALDTLPATLDETYLRILSDIDSIEHEKAMVLLRWLAYARRPLTVRELVETVIVNPNDEPVVADVSERPLLAGVLRLLSGLIITVARKELGNKDQNEDWEENSTNDISTYENFPAVRIQLAHFSVKEYLESERSISSAFHLDWADDQQFLLDCCVTYLLHYSESEERDCTYEDLEAFPLLRYSAMYWHEYYRETGNIQRVLLFLLSQTAVASWMESFRFDPYLPDDRPTQINDLDRDSFEGINLASCFGLHTVVEVLIELGSIATMPAEFHGGALAAAARYGYVRIVEMLIEAGINVNAQTQRGCGVSALMAAARGGHEEIFKMLIKAGADLNIQAEHEDYGTALIAAAANGHRGMTEILIAAGVDINAQDCRGESALMTAAIYQNKQIVKMLIEAGADVNMQTEHGFYGTALIASISNEEILMMLIEAGADVNAQVRPQSLTSWYYSVLAAAAQHGNKKLMEMLIESYGANINAHDRSFDIVLRAAAEAGQTEVVKMVIENYGIAINAQGEHYNRALLLALRRGRLETAKMLIEDYGANINAHDESLNNILGNAMMTGDLEIVKILIKHHRADTKLQGESFGSALRGAVSSGCPEAVRTLIEDYGADVNMRDEYFGTPLMTAVAIGNKQLVQMLVKEYGADVNAQIQRRGYNNALIIAASFGHRQILKLLLENGADVGTQVGGYGTVLQAASESGHARTVKMLIEEYNADVNVQSGVYGSALHAAAARGHERICKILIDAGANMGIQDEEGRTVLHYAAQSGNTAIFTLLVKIERHNLSIRDKHGRTVLDYVYMSGSARMLVEYHNMGHNSFKDVSASIWSPFHWACRTGSYESLKLLSDMKLQASTVETSKPSAKWTPMDIAIFFKNYQLVSRDGKLKKIHDWQSILHSGFVQTDPANARQIIPIRENTLAPARYNSEYHCNGCLLVRPSS